MDLRPDIAALADMHDEASCTGKEELLRSVFHPDARLWNNVREVERTVDEQLAVRRMEWQYISGLAFTQVRRLPTPEGYIQQMTVCGSVGDTDVRIPACFVVTVENDRIRRIDEYVNSTHAQPILAALGLDSAR